MTIFKYIVPAFVATFWLNAFADQEISTNQTASASNTSAVVANGGALVIDRGVIISAPQPYVDISVSGVPQNSITNNGQITSSTTGGASIIFNSTSSLGLITNNSSGSITGKSTIQLLTPASIVNSGTITGTDRALYIESSLSPSSITNYASGYIQGNYSAIGNHYGATITNLYNAGNINGGIIGVENYNSTIGTLTNFGHIYGGGGGAISGGVVTTIDNFGTISSTSRTNVITSTVTNLVNSQAGLIITNQPTNYFASISSSTSYGQLSVVILTGATMNFGIYSGGVSGAAASSVTATTYGDVLQGFNSLSNVTGTTGNYGGLNYSLVSDPLHSGEWNLVFVSPTTNITGRGNVYFSNNLGNTLNPVFDGGTLQVSSSGTISTPFSITSNNGTIDQSGQSSNFSGNISDSGAGVNGKLTIVNSGTAGQGSVTLSGNNTYSGGTEVDAGADLSISSGSALGTGTLALIGTATTPSTLTTTATTTINNAITVVGDPVFNVAPSTTTTVTSAITDGGTPGDVVVQGGGTLNLTAQNTYRGLTSIAAGSTLALSGNGSIASSNNVTNNGTLDLTAKTGTATLGGTYVQSSTGKLSLLFSPANSQALTIAGSASLAGTLALTGTAGTYKAGKYTLLSANGQTGQFSALVSNLASLTPLGFNLSYDANDVYLTLTPSVAETQASLAMNAVALRGVYALQTEEINNGLNYDCGVFDKNAICVSAGGRYSNAAATGSNSTSGLLIGAFRINDQVRVGAWAEQSFGSSTPAGITLGNGSPMFGLFGVWSQYASGDGLEARVSAGYGDRDLTVTRSAVGLTGESGSGSTSLNTGGVSAVLSYNLPISPQWTVIPYAGIRYTSIRANAYTENASSSVTAPLTYSDLTQQSTTALASIRLFDKISTKVGLFSSVGFEQDLSNTGGTYTATGITGLTAIALNPSIRKTRPVASLGGYYEIAKAQRINLSAFYTAGTFQGANSTTALLTYSAGF